jgi:hypothetical protein
MRARTLFLTTVALLLGSALLAPDAQAGKGGSYPISEGTAKSVCKKLGAGGTMAAAGSVTETTVTR